MRVALKADWVVDLVHIARAIADCVKALDGFVVLVEGLEIIVDMNATHAGKHCGDYAKGIEGALFNRIKQVGILEEFGVLAIFAVLVVALYRFEEGFFCSASMPIASASSSRVSAFL